MALPRSSSWNSATTVAGIDRPIADPAAMTTRATRRIANVGATAVSKAPAPNNASPLTWTSSVARIAAVSAESRAGGDA